MRLKRLSSAAVIATVVVLSTAPTVFASHPEWEAGTGTIQQTCGADLDHHAFDCAGGSTSTTKDVYFIAHTSTNRVIQYNNYNFSSKLWKKSSKPSYAMCASGPPNNGFNEYNAKQNVGHWFCVQTTESRFARVRIDQVVAGGAMTISYKTWCKPADGC